VGRLAGDPLLEEVLADLRRATGGRDAAAGPGLQAPVSFRVAPRVLAQLRRTLGRLDEDVRRALVAVTDSPAVAGGRVVAGGGFHAPASCWPPARRGGCAGPGRRPGWGRSSPASRTWSLPWTGTDRSAPT